MAAPTTPAGVLRRAAALGVGRLDAQLIVAALLDRPRSWVLAHDDVALNPAIAEAAEALLNRRLAGEPLAYLLGHKEFHGLMLAVTPAVLVPRPDTETLVAWALETGVCEADAPRVIDLGTGSGAIALALKAARPPWQLVATDASRDALAVAAGNAGRLGLEVQLRCGDWWQAVADDARFDLAVANPPYIPEADPHLAPLRHEPRAALASGTDGLDALRALISAAPRHLNPGAWLLLEHGFDQSAAVRDLLEDCGFSDIDSRFDLAGHIRCTGGRCRHANVID